MELLAKFPEQRFVSVHDSMTPSPEVVQSDPRVLRRALFPHGNNAHPWTALDRHETRKGSKSCLRGFEGVRPLGEKGFRRIP